MLTETVERKIADKRVLYWQLEVNQQHGMCSSQGKGRAHNCHTIYEALNKLVDLSVPVFPLHGVVRINEFIHAEPLDHVIHATQTFARIITD